METLYEEREIRIWQRKIHKLKWKMSLGDRQWCCDIDQSDFIQLLAQYSGRKKVRSGKEGCMGNGNRQQAPPTGQSKQLNWTESSTIIRLVFSLPVCVSIPKMHCVHFWGQEAAVVGWGRIGPMSLKGHGRAEEMQQNWILLAEWMRFLPSVLVFGGFLMAQFVRIEREPNHWPFIAVMAVSASCKNPTPSPIPL